MRNKVAHFGTPKRRGSPSIQARARDRSHGKTCGYRESRVTLFCSIRQLRYQAIVPLRLPGPLPSLQITVRRDSPLLSNPASDDPYGILKVVLCLLFEWNFITAIPVLLNKTKVLLE